MYTELPTIVGSTSQDKLFEVSALVYSAGICKVKACCLTTHRSTLQAQLSFLSIYIKLPSVCLFVCVFVPLCGLNR